MWNDGSQITIHGVSAPESNHGPALAAGPNTFYVAYVGEGGENLYMSYRDIDAQNPASWAASPWKGNKQIKLPNGTEPKANDRPAIAAFPLSLLLVYTDHKSGHLMSLSYDEAWQSNPPIDVFPDNLSFRQPLMTVSNYDVLVRARPGGQSGTDIDAVLHLVAMDKKTGNLWYSWQSFDLELPAVEIVTTPWQTAVQINIPAAVKNVTNWSLTSVSGTAYLFGFTKDIICVCRKQTTDAVWEYYITQYPPGPINPWAAVAQFGNSLQLIYTPKGTQNLNIVPGAGDATVLDLNGMTPMNPGGVQAKTNEAPAATAFPLQTAGPAQTMLVAYKANSSDKLHFAYLT